MQKFGYSLLLALCLAPSGSFGLSKEEIGARLNASTVLPESELPALPNQPGTFPGVVNHPGLEAHTWVRYPFVSNAGSLAMDRAGRIYVVEANRFWCGVPDNRGIIETVPDDFRSTTVQDRLDLYQRHAARFPEDYFTRVADRVILLEDRDANGAADHRTVFSDHFNRPEDGLAFSILPEDDAVYLTCIPYVWKMTDTNADGIADTHDPLVGKFGMRNSFLGHDLHGIIRGPDGLLYFSVGDRGYRIPTAEGGVITDPGGGGIFRCESDGSNVELVCGGLRNPQELAFDAHGNLFTFDNTGDIGDKGRLVYALEGTDSGWDMSHQSPHHYVQALDWGNFHPKTSVWMSEHMFETFTEDQPQWVYPPAGHAVRGPSGFTYLTGESLPEDLRGKFLVTNYRGAPTYSTTIAVDVAPRGAGFTVVGMEDVLTGVGASDVALGFDGRLYLADWGGGWSVNKSAGVHVLSSKDPALLHNGAKVAQLIQRGMGNLAPQQILTHLDSPDQRVRQMAQFELVRRGDAGRSLLVAEATDTSFHTLPRLHAIWGLGQLLRNGSDTQLEAVLAGLMLGDPQTEIRANAVRTLGSADPGLQVVPPLIACVSDASPRVQSLALIALSRVAAPGDTLALAAIRQAVRQNAGSRFDPVIRHAAITALDRLATGADLADWRTDADYEVRLAALLFDRRHPTHQLANWLEEADPRLQMEAARAIYDTPMLDGPAGEALAQSRVMASGWLMPVQRRVVAANFRLGARRHARNLIKIAGDDALHEATRAAALQALLMWDSGMVTDPVLGHYRPAVREQRRSMAKLGVMLGDDLARLLAADLPPAIAALGLQLSTASGVRLDEDILRQQVVNTDLDPEVRVAALDKLVNTVSGEAAPIVTGLLDAADPELVGAALRHGFALGLPGLDERAMNAAQEGPLPAARAALAGLAETRPELLVAWWKNRAEGMREELWLDLYLALAASSDPTARAVSEAYATTDRFAVQQLTLTGGDFNRGRDVFQNQGACMQCHKARGGGGEQGPHLGQVGERLTSQQLLQSLLEPSAEITEGYALTGFTLQDGSNLSGTVESRSDDHVVLKALDGSTTTLDTSDIAEEAPPISAMPAMGLSLSPEDLRDLVTFLHELRRRGEPAADASAHGEGDEAIAK